MKITKGIYTTVNSDLYWKVKQVYVQNDEYVEAKVLFFYKSNDNICTWLNPSYNSKTVKFKNPTMVDMWTTYK